MGIVNIKIALRFLSKYKCKLLVNDTLNAFIKITMKRSFK